MQITTTGNVLQVTAYFPKPEKKKTQNWLFLAPNNRRKDTTMQIQLKRSMNK